MNPYVGLVIAIIMLISVIMILVGIIGLLNANDCKKYSWMLIGGTGLWIMGMFTARLMIPGGMSGLGSAIKGNNEPDYQAMAIQLLQEDNFESSGYPNQEYPVYN